MARPATLRVDILADSKQATAELDGFSAKVAGFAAGVSGAVANFAINKVVEGATFAANFITDGIEDAASLSAALSTLNTNYGDTAAFIAKWAEKAATAFGISELAAVQAANRFSVYTRALGISGLEAAAFSTDLVRLSADLAAYNDLTVDQAIQAIGSAFRGERDPIEQFGILLNDASVKAAYFRKTGEEVNGTLTTQQNIVGTLAALQEQSATATGAFAKESDQLANQEQILNARLKDLRLTIGEKLLPITIQFFGWLNDEGLPRIERFARALADNIGPAITTVVSFIRDTLIPAFQDLGNWIDANVVPILEKLGNFISTEIAPRLEQFGELVGKYVGPIVEELGPKFQKLWNQVKDLRDALEPLIERIGALIGPAVGAALLQQLGLIIGAFQLLSWAVDLVTAAVKFVAGEVRLAIDLWNGFYEILEKAWDLYERFVAAPVAKVFDFVGGAVDFINPFDLTSGNRSQALTVNYYTNVTAEIPPGVNGWDAGANIALALNDYYARTGYKVP